MVLVAAVDVEGWGGLDVAGRGVSLDDGLAGLLSDVDVTVSDAGGAGGLNSGESLPLVGETLAVAAGGVDESNNPDVLGVSNNSLLEGLDFDSVVLLPDTVVLSVGRGSVAIVVIRLGLVAVAVCRLGRVSITISWLGVALVAVVA